MYPPDNRLMHCKYCQAKQAFNVNNLSEREALEMWENYHRGCRRKLSENKIIIAMRTKNKKYLFNEFIANQAKQDGEDL